MVTVLPAIITALAVYVGLVYVDKIARRVTSAFDNGGQAEHYIREVDGVVDHVPIIERPPPPSPEALIEARARVREAAESAVRPALPVLIPELEPEKIPLRRIPIQPLEAPPVPISGTPATP